MRFILRITYVLMLSVLITTHAYAHDTTSTQFTRTTRMLLPEFSVEPMAYRIGGAMSVTTNDQLGYFGERFAIVSFNTHTIVPDTQTYFGFATGGFLGLSTSSGFTPFSTGFQLDTVDAYYGFLLESRYKDSVGIGITFDHISAHFGDGRFKNASFVKISQNFISIRLVYMPAPTIDLQLQANAYVWSSLGTALQITAATMWRFLSLFQAEALLSYKTTNDFYEFFRFKVSYWPVAHTHRLVPFILAHNGHLFFGRRANEKIDLLILAGLELVL